MAMVKVNRVTLVGVRWVLGLLTSESPTRRLTYSKHEAFSSPKEAQFASKLISLTPIC